MNIPGIKRQMATQFSPFLTKFGGWELQDSNLMGLLVTNPQ